MNRRAPRPIAGFAALAAIAVGAVVAVWSRADRASENDAYTLAPAALRLPAVEDTLTFHAPTRSDLARLPSIEAQPPATSTPPLEPLPPPPLDASVPVAPLPPLADELKRTGGSYLYEAEGGPRPPPPPGKKPPPAPLRIPETFEAPQPLTIFSDYLGADPVAIHPPPLDGALGHMGYAWDPRIVGAGGYTLMGSMFDSGTTPTQGMIGHQLVLDLDAQWTGTERIHVQFRPLGPRNTGGSFYRFTAPVEYLDNFTAVPDRYWFEAELHSLLGLSSSAYLSDVRVTAGKFPLQLHNNLLVNDELVGVSLSQSTLVPPRLGSLSLAGFYAWNDVDSTTVSDSQVAGLHLSTEYRTMLFEATGAYVNNDIDSRRDQLHTAVSATYFKGPRCFVGRALGKWGDAAGTGPGQLFVLETNRSWDFETPRWGVQSAVTSVGAFHVESGWNSIAAANFNSMRVQFETSPLVQYAARGASDASTGLLVGAQLFRRKMDESVTPEMALEWRENSPVFTFGVRYLRKTGKRSYFELLIVDAESSEATLERRGLMAGQTILF